MTDLTETWQPDGRLDVTCGDWTVESDAEDFLAQFLAATGMFRAYRQVFGEPLWKHFFQEHQAVKADVLLLPTEKLFNAGWRSGAIVVEVKRSGEKIGPGCNQLIDYTNSVFFLPSGVAVVPTFGFLFPALKQHGPLASVMAHQHLGTAVVQHGSLYLFCGESRVLTLCQDGRIDFGNVNFGRRLGAR